ncbi:hypothetical protein [Streptomyces mangrovisoli]|uniref:hypothetical protein n=1 Tax=Streptomyces mangrovisoli TaxID=1428628 RepID=UPI000ACDC5D1|nr:hypothetical protein [Streptomyces mangrovisoli]
MSAPERDETPARAVPVVTMRELLASCAAAAAVSTPPRLPDPAPRTCPGPRPHDHREAA